MAARVWCYTVIGVLAVCVVSHAETSMAQDIAGPLAAPDAAPPAILPKPNAAAKPHPAANQKAAGKTSKTASKAAASKAKAAATDKAQPPEPWAAVDPGRVAPRADNRGATSDGTPTVARDKPVDDPVSLGMKWNGSNTPNYGAATTSGLINEYNHDLGGASTGSGAEVGVKLKF